MKRVLIAEDEKLIRQGLRSIIVRSGISIEEIIECKNGEEALAVLQAMPVDVLFTDIRMPKMDGITLLRTIQEETGWQWPKPEVVVVSGYGDFNYAVEAMRYGAKEYLLKPIRRERVVETLQKLEKTIEQQNEKQRKQVQFEKLGQQHIKYGLTDPGLSQEELGTIQSALQDLFSFSAYAILCSNRELAFGEEELAFQVESRSIFRTVVVSKEIYKKIAAGMALPGYSGGSPVYHDMADFHKAFEQAVQARKRAFYTGKNQIGEAQIEYSQQEFLGTKSSGQLARYIGAKEYPELVHLVERLQKQAASEILAPDAFENAILQFLTELEKTFPKLLENEKETVNLLKEIYSSDTVNEYCVVLLEWLDSLNARVVREMECSSGNERIGKAVDYINSNYEKNLNMAMVSNYVSMNYSMFSKMFKEYTGKSFVEYLRELRIEKAKELLTQTPYKITEISERVGFENDKYFIKSFKAMLGVSPNQYRRIQQMNEPE